MDVNKVRQIGRTTVKDSGFYLKNDVYNRIKQLRLVLQTNFNAKILSPPAISQMRKRIPSDVTSKLVIALLVFLTLPSTFFSFSMSASSSLVKKTPMLSFFSVLHFISSVSKLTPYKVNVLCVSMAIPLTSPSFYPTHLTSAHELILLAHHLLYFLNQTPYIWSTLLEQTSAPYSPETNFYFFHNVSEILFLA